MIRNRGSRVEGKRGEKLRKPGRKEEMKQGEEWEKTGKEKNKGCRKGDY